MTKGQRDHHDALRKFPDRNARSSEGLATEIDHVDAAPVRQSGVPRHKGSTRPLASPIIRGDALSDVKNLCVVAEL